VFHREVDLLGNAFGETGMLDGNRYYAAFPDENPEIRLRMRTLFDLLKKLEKEFRQHIEQFPIEPTPADGDSEQDSRNHRSNSNHRGRLRGWLSERRAGA
jgi:hypothetical protein